MNWERLREKLLEKYYPEEDEIRDARELYSQLSQYIKDQHDLETHFAGSTGRGTCMTGDKDIDLFILFPEDTDRKELEDRGLSIGREVFEQFDGESEISYAEHPYTKGEIRGHEVEIVPCIDTSPENIRTSVDRTPHHSRWVDEHLDEEQRKDVVILKRFLSSQDLYGSSLKVQGFSGYLCEILIAHFGSFRGLMREAEDWREKQVIDPENHHEGSLPAELEDKFSDELLRVIDPVDQERNVASVLSDENYARFIYEAWRFNSSPGMNFFEDSGEDVSKFDVKQEVKSRGDFIVVEFGVPDAVEDVVYPQMRKALGRIEDELEDHDFRIYESGFHVGEKVRIFFELDSTLPEIKLKQGPKPFHGSEHIDQFTSKYENTFVKDRSLYAKVQREYTDARKFLSDFVSRESEELEKDGVPEHVADKMESARLVEPLQDDEKWLKYLAESLNVNTK
jgi:tRNA nucleotidyltransferase (CCA-adding enzyme)